LPFEWTPDFWQGWRESSNPYRQFKSGHDRELTVQALDLRDGERVLEVGCGYGWITQALLNVAKIRWVGVDRSESMLRQFCSVAPSEICRVSLADAARLPFLASSFDKVLCTGVLMHVRDEFAVLREMARVLRPGGRLVCSMNNALSPFSLPVRLRNSFKNGFIQNFRTPARYRGYLHSLGLELHATHGDALWISVPVQIGKLSWPPAFAFSFLRPMDQWAVARAPSLAFEIWFTATKPDGSCAS
jgi:SAM-dependent methyltransferase